MQPGLARVRDNISWTQLVGLVLIKLILLTAFTTSNLKYCIYSMTRHKKKIQMTMRGWGRWHLGSFATKIDVQLSSLKLGVINYSDHNKKEPMRKDRFATIISGFHLFSTFIVSTRHFSENLGSVEVKTSNVQQWEHCSALNRKRTNWIILNRKKTN